MLKKALASTFIVILTVTAIGCSKTTKEEKNETLTTIAELAMTNGEFSIDYTQGEVDNLNVEISEGIKELIAFYGLEYLEDAEVKEENNEKVKDTYIYFDNLEAEANRLESLYYGYRSYGENQDRASLVLKLGFKLDLDQIKNEKKFSFEETSMAKFSEVMSKKEGRDYLEINNKIIEIVNSEAKTGSITNNVNGLEETIMIKDDYLLYRLDSKIYNFK